MDVRHFCERLCVSISLLLVVQLLLGQSAAATLDIDISKDLKHRCEAHFRPQGSTTLNPLSLDDARYFAHSSAGGRYSLKYMDNTPRVDDGIAISCTLTDEIDSAKSKFDPRHMCLSYDINSEKQFSHVYIFLRGRGSTNGGLAFRTEPWSSWPACLGSSTMSHCKGVGISTFTVDGDTDTKFFVSSSWPQNVWKTVRVCQAGSKITLSTQIEGAAEEVLIEKEVAADVAWLDRFFSNEESDDKILWIEPSMWYTGAILHIANIKISFSKSICNEKAELKTPSVDLSANLQLTTDVTVQISNVDTVNFGYRVTSPSGKEIGGFVTSSSGDKLTLTRSFAFLLEAGLLVESSVGADGKKFKVEAFINVNILCGTQSQVTLASYKATSSLLAKTTGTISVKLLTMISSNVEASISGNFDTGVSLVIMDKESNKQLTQDSVLKSGNLIQGKLKIVGKDSNSVKLDIVEAFIREDRTGSSYQIIKAGRGQDELGLGVSYPELTEFTSHASFSCMTRSTVAGSVTVIVTYEVSFANSGERRRRSEVYHGSTHASFFVLTDDAHTSSGSTTKDPFSASSVGSVALMVVGAASVVIVAVGVVVRKKKHSRVSVGDERTVEQAPKLYANQEAVVKNPLYMGDDANPGSIGGASNSTYEIDFTHEAYA